MAEHHQAAAGLTPWPVGQDLLTRMRGGGGYWVVVVILALLAAAGLARVCFLILSGPEPRDKWGYSAAVLGFLLSTAHAAPLLAFATRFAKGFWAVPARRAAELFAVSGLVTTPLFFVLLLQLPDWKGRWSIWFDWPGAPLFYDTLAMALLSILGLILLWVNGIPDFAHARDRRTGVLAGPLALGWTGTKRQWQVHSTGIIVLGAFYLTLYAYVHMYMVTDLGMSLVHGWKSAIIPAYHAVSGLQGGIAAVIVALAVMRKVAGLEDYIRLNVFWGAAKLLLGTTLLFFYFTWAELLTMWYGRMPEEQAVLALLMLGGPYQALFICSFVFNFVAPWLLLIFNRVRVSIAGPVFVASIVLVGNFIDRVRIYVASWSVAGPVGQHLDLAHLPATRYPGEADVAVIVGALAAVGLLYLIATRFLPPVSIWEYKNGLLLTVEREFIRSKVAVVAKPR